DDDHMELVEVLFEIGDEHGAAIVRPVVMMCSQYRPDHARELLMVLAFVIHKDAGEILGIEEISHGAERDHHHAVVIVVATLHLVLVNTNHFKAHAVDPDTLSEGGFTGKEPLPRYIADDRHTGVLEFVI